MDFDKVTNLHENTHHNIQEGLCGRALGTFKQLLNRVVDVINNRLLNMHGRERHCTLKSRRAEGARVGNFDAFQCVVVWRNMEHELKGGGKERERAVSNKRTANESA